MSPQLGKNTLPDDFGRWHFIREIGSGSTSEVFLVERSETEHLAVMKICRAGLDATARDRFQGEAQLLQQLHHPNIPRFHDFGLVPDGRLFLVIEYVEGKNLKEILQRSAKLNVNDVVSLAKGIASALEAAHQKQILHLDVKPANILVPVQDESYRFENAKLIDFSVLGRLEPNTNATRAGEIQGTIHYMSREQLCAEALTTATDVFGLGCVLYEMLSGRRPFANPRGSEDVSGTIAAILNGTLHPLPEGMPEPLSSLVMQCLSKDPHKRPVLGREFAQALNEMKGPLWDRNLRADAAPDCSEACAEETTLLPRKASASVVSLDVHPNEKLHQEVAAVLPRPSATFETTGNSAFLLFAAGLAFLALVGAVLLFITLRPAAPQISLNARLIVGLALIVAGVGMGWIVRRYLIERKQQLSGDVADVLSGARTTEMLTMTLSIQVDDVIKKCRMMDEKFLGMTMAIMVKEYSSGANFDDRQKALMNAVAILEKLVPKLSPWYVRYDKLIAAGVSLVGIASGVITSSQAVAKMLK